jgi:hypothetical protein
VEETATDPKAYPTVVAVRAQRKKGEGVSAGVVDASR